MLHRGPGPAQARPSADDTVSHRAAGSGREPRDGGTALVRRWSVQRLVLGLVLLAALWGPLGTPDRTTAAAAGLAPRPAMGTGLAAVAQQGGDLATGSNVEVKGTQGDGLRVRAAPSLTGDVSAV